MARSFRTLATTLAVVTLLVLAGAAPARANRIHTVRPGQNLARIAHRYRVDVADLAAANRMRRNATLRVGQQLRIPARGEIYVRPGDTLSHIAARHRVSVEDLRRSNRLRRGRGLRAGQRLVLPGYAPEEQADRDWGEPDEPGVVTIVRRGERTRLRLVDEEGRVLREALSELGELMRRHDDDPVQVPNPRLALFLAKLSDHFGGRPISVVSGWRESSRHTTGRATDIRVRGVPNRAVWEVCRRYGHAGCGFYPRSTFVHVDARLRRTQWVDWSRPGQRPRYGTLRGPANRRRRRRMPRPRQRWDLPVEIVVLEADGSATDFVDRLEEGLDDEEEPENEPDEAVAEGEDDGEDDGDDDDAGERAEDGASEATAAQGPGEA